MVWNPDVTALAVTGTDYPTSVKDWSIDLSNLTFDFSNLSAYDQTSEKVTLNPINKTSMTLLSGVSEIKADAPKVNSTWSSRLTTDNGTLDLSGSWAEARTDSTVSVGFTLGTMAYNPDNTYDWSSGSTNIQLDAAKSYDFTGVDVDLSNVSFSLANMVASDSMSFLPSTSEFTLLDFNNATVSNLSNASLTKPSDSARGFSYTIANGDLTVAGTWDAVVKNKTSTYAGGIVADLGAYSSITYNRSNPYTWSDKTNNITLGSGSYNFSGTNFDLSNVTFDFTVPFDQLTLLQSKFRLLDYNNSSVSGTNMNNLQLSTNRNFTYTLGSGSVMVAGNWNAVFTANTQAASGGLDAVQTISSITYSPSTAYDWTTGSTGIKLDADSSYDLNGTTFNITNVSFNMQNAFELNDNALLANGTFNLLDFNNATVSGYDNNHITKLADSSRVYSYSYYDDADNRIALVSGKWDASFSTSGLDANIVSIDKITYQSTGAIDMSTGGNGLQLASGSSYDLTNTKFDLSSTSFDLTNLAASSSNTSYRLLDFNGVTNTGASNSNLILPDADKRVYSYTTAGDTVEVSGKWGAGFNDNGLDANIISIDKITPVWCARYVNGGQWSETGG